MTVEYKFQDGLHPSLLLQNLFELQQTGCLCDVTLVIGEKEIRAHKAVLASASPYFWAMFNSGLKETTEDRVVMHEMEYSALSDIVHYFYTTQITITEDNVYSLMEMADLLQVSALRSTCSHYLMTTLSPNNCLSVYVRASLRSYDDLAHRAFRYILKNFRFVMYEEEFLHTPPETLLAILTSRLLNIVDESHLLEGVIKWWKHDQTERSPFLKSLISKIFLEKVVVEKLIGYNLEIEEASKGISLQIKDVIDRIIAQCDGDVDSLLQNRRKTIEQRERYSMEQEVILAIGGESSGMALGNVECLTMGYESWKCIVPTSVHDSGSCDDTRVIPTMHYPRFFAAVASKDYEVFVIGGTNSTCVLDVVEYYSIQSNVWSKLTPLPVAVQGAAAAFLDQQLYVAGGRGKDAHEKRVWVYEEHQNSWREAPAMNKHRSYHRLVTVFGALYALGGIGGEDGTAPDKYLKCMEKYDQGRNRWYMVASMHEERSSFGCEVLDEYIYVMGGYDGKNWLKSVERYNTSTNEWCFMTPMSVPRSHFCTTVSNRRIYCIGGHDSIHYLNTVEKFNPNTNRWHCVYAMQVRRYGGGAATLHVPLYSSTQVDLIFS